VALGILVKQREEVEGEGRVTRLLRNVISLGSRYTYNLSNHNLICALRPNYPSGRGEGRAYRH